MLIKEVVYIILFSYNSYILSMCSLLTLPCIHACITSMIVEVLCVYSKWESIKHGYDQLSIKVAQLHIPPHLLHIHVC